jgi:hypothetical protein
MRTVRQDACPFVSGVAVGVVVEVSVVTVPRRCERCGGWLFVEPEGLADGAIELGCIACGNRLYVTVARQVVGRRRTRRWQRMESQAS